MPSKAVIRKAPLYSPLFRHLKEIMPEVNFVYMRSDNAGCYHCAFTLFSVYHVASQHVIELKRFDFSEPQGGKGSCDQLSPILSRNPSNGNAHWTESKPFTFS